MHIAGESGAEQGSYFNVGTLFGLKGALPFPTPPRVFDPITCNIHFEFVQDEPYSIGLCLRPRVGNG